MLRCNHANCGAKKGDCSPYQAGDVCPNGHSITTADLAKAEPHSVETQSPTTFGVHCPKCGHPNDDGTQRQRGDECSNCHEIL